MKQVRLSDYLYEVVKEKIRRRTKKAHPTMKDIEDFISEMVNKWT